MWKIPECFHKNRSRENGLSTECKECQNKKYTKLTDQKKRERHILRYYGMKWGEYKRLYDEQNGKCPICDIPLQFLNGKKGQRRDSTHVDHCHKTGQIRNLLCNQCNLALGYFADNIIVMEKATKYLKRWEALLS
jgi:hypothetical protein